MKRFIIKLLLGLLVVLSVSCSKDDENESFTSMEIDGEEVIINRMQVFDIGEGEYSIIAQDDWNGEPMTVEMNIIIKDESDLQLSLDPIDQEADISIEYNSDVYSTIYGESTGTLTITSFTNNRIEATFNCKAYKRYSDSEFITVENGVVKANF
jgi:hypothetical protein